MLLSFHMPMMSVYEKYNDVLIESPLFFVCGIVSVKSIRVERDVDREPPTFCTWRCMCTKYKSRAGCRSRAPCFLYVALCM
jgi:hypothetical protein